MSLYQIYGGYMGYFFVDIETYLSKDNPNSGLNPYEKESKILAIAYNYYDEFHLSEKHVTPPTILKEWESSEKQILEKFFNFLKIKVELDQHIKIIGFNHLKFDIPYIIGRLVVNKVSNNREIHEIFFRRPHYIDLGQISQILSGNKFKEIFNVNQKTANSFFDIPLKKESGKKVSEYYKTKDFEKIREYVKSEFTFEKLYISLRRHIYKKGTMIKDDEKTD